MLLTNTIGNLQDLTIKNISFNLQCQKLKQEKREVEMHIAPILLSEIIAPFFSEQESDSTTYYIINPIIGSVFGKQLHDII